MSKVAVFEDKPTRQTNAFGIICFREILLTTNINTIIRPNAKNQGTRYQNRGGLPVLNPSGSPKKHEK
jgi:hypothetical protein